MEKQKEARILAIQEERKNKELQLIEDAVIKLFSILIIRNLPWL